MAARITGGRTAPRVVRPSGGRTGDRITSKTGGGAETRRLIQLVICSGAFVLLVAGKLLLPERTAPIGQALEQSLNRNMDVQSVFSALGRSFAGDGKASEMAEEVWEAVFRPDGETAEVLNPEGIPEQPALSDEGAALKSLREYRDGASESGTPTGSGTASKQETVLYSGKDLPDRVHMEQAILNFDYCTPVLGTLTSGFGYRTQPGTGEERFHYGLDLAADSGTPVLCFAAGTVTAVGESVSYGKYCIVNHAGGWSTLYAHCSRISAGAGETVTLGQEIAQVGQTGNATGPHLHFELQKENTYYNPVYYVARG